MDKINFDRLGYISRNRRFEYIDKLKKYLESFNKGKYFYNAYYILNELISYINEVNLSRLYFKNNNCKIDSFESYIKCLSEYCSNKESLFEAYKKELEKNSSLDIKFDIYFQDDYFFIGFIINSVLTMYEKKVVRDSIDIEKIDVTLDALSREINNNKLINKNFLSIIFLLKNMGLNRKFLNYKESDEITKIYVRIPVELLENVRDEIIADEISKEIESIPQYPQHILETIHILNNPNSNFHTISDTIKKDPSLIADILKIANSPIYQMYKKIETIEEAVRTIGIKAIKNLVLSYSTNKIFMNKYNINLVKNIIKHSNEVAFYATELSKLINDKELLENVYVSAMLHDFGKIIINSIEPGLVESIQSLCIKNGLNNFSIESLTNGYNHSIIGAKLSEMWNFPDYLFESIKYHHIPHDNRIKNKSVVYAVYLSNIAYYYSRNMYNFENIDFYIMDFFSLSEKDSFDNFINSSAEKFDKIKSSI